METKILDSEYSFFHPEESRKLSYEMLFADTESYEAGSFDNAGAGDDEAEPETGEEAISRKKLELLEAQWKEKLEQAKEEAFREGIEKGREAGKKEALELLDERLEPIVMAVEEAKGQVNNLMDDIRPYMATMVFDLAEKVIDIPMEDERLRKQVADEINEMLETLDRDVKVRITVSEQDHKYVSKAIEKGLPDQRIDFKSSAKLKPGEYSIDTARERMVKNFKKILKDFREEVALTAEDQEEGE